MHTRSRRRAALVGAALSLAGCSHLVARGNAGIPFLERSTGPVRGVSVGAKYTGWVLATPLTMVMVPVSLLAWATPWVDLVLAVDIMWAPALGLGYAFQGLIGLPTWAALSWTGEPLREDEPGVSALPGFVVDHRAATRPARPAARLQAEDVSRYAVDPQAASEIRCELLRHWDPQAASSEPLQVALPRQGPWVSSLEFYPAVARGEGPRPLLLIVPPTSLGFVARWLAVRYARRGIHVAVIQSDVAFLDPTQTPDEFEAKLRGAVLSARCVLAALRELPEVVPTRTGYLGVSAGAIFGGVLVAVEPGIRRAALVFPGGDLPEIVRTSQEPELIAWRKALKSALGSDEAVTSALRAVIASDPQRLAPFVDPDRLLLFMGAGDTKVPVACGEALRTALGEPETWRLAGDHDTAVLCFGFLLREIDAFLFDLR